MIGLTTGREPRCVGYCANCRTTGAHKLIVVTADLELLWCERCGVPHVAPAGSAEKAAEPEAPLAEPDGWQAGFAAPVRPRWRWWQLKGAPPQPRA